MNDQTSPETETLLDRVAFNDDADEPKTWRGLAHSILLDMFRYAKDEGPERRLVSADAYVQDVMRLANMDSLQSLGHAQRQQEWQPIETAPHETRVLLGWIYDGQWFCETGMASHGWRRNGVSNMSRHGHATHWQPLPAALTDSSTSHEGGK